MYCCSKAALNMFSAITAADWAGTDRVVVSVSPGWVRTDMGGSGANLAADESVRGMLDALGQMTPKQSGQFIDYQGEQKPF